MEKMKRKIATPLAGLMLFITVISAFPADGLAAKKPQLSPKKFELTVGKLRQVKLKNAKKAKKTKWSAKPKNAVKLSKKKKNGVRVKGVKAAKKVTLTAKFRLGKKQRKATCTIVVRKAENSPTNEPVSPTTDTSVNPPASPTVGPPVSPTVGPPVSPTVGPPVSPTVGPPTSPTVGPPTSPTVGPPTSPTVGPSTSPTVDPSTSPTVSPSTSPTVSPSTSPTVGPPTSPTVGPPTNPPTSLPPGVYPKTPMGELPAPETFTEDIPEPPDLLTMFDGHKVETKEQWEERRQEIKEILQYYMYGIWREGENVTATSRTTGSTKRRLTINIEHQGREGSFFADVVLPAASGAPEGGWPIMVTAGGVGDAELEYIRSQGYAMINILEAGIAEINSSHTSTDEKKGAFYNLYPYDNDDWRNQTGAVMAWAWGYSKILDALEVEGFAASLNVNKDFAIAAGFGGVTGPTGNMSGYAKTAACAGAFDERFKVSMAYNSGYGGFTMGRYQSSDTPFDLLPDYADDPAKDQVNLEAWTRNVQDTTRDKLPGSFYNGNYAKFDSFDKMPFDAHFLVALSCMEGRSVFMDSIINYDSYGSAPGLWYTYECAKPAFDLMELSNNIAIQYNLNSGIVQQVDLYKLFSFIDVNIHGKELDKTKIPEDWSTMLADWDPSQLTTCVFGNDDNEKPYNEGKVIRGGVLPSPSPSTSPTVRPSTTPTARPSATPTATVRPSVTPTARPSTTPTARPSTTPTARPSATPTARPSATPTTRPSATPTARPSATPTAGPSATPTAGPSATPTPSPTATPTAEPTVAPLTPIEELPSPETLTDSNPNPPDLLTMFSGAEVKSKEQWEERKEEIKGMLQYYMYGKCC